jgi:hypothetical protein
VTYILAVLSLSAACMLWYLIQRWAGKLDEPPCEDAGSDCESCYRRDEAARVEGMGRARQGGFPRPVRRD